jgi:uncharacterized protein DUF993
MRGAAAAFARLAERDVVVFLAWLNGLQDHFHMLAGLESSRGIVHYADVFRLADKAALFEDPDLAASRMRSLLSMYGITS